MGIQAIVRAEEALFKARAEQVAILDSFRDTIAKIYSISLPSRQEAALRRARGEYNNAGQKVENAIRALDITMKAHKLLSVGKKPDPMDKKDLDYARSEWLRGCDLIAESAKLLEEQKMKCIKELEDSHLWVGYFATFNACCDVFETNKNLFEDYYRNFMEFSKKNPKKADLEISTYLIDVKRHISLKRSFDLISRQYQEMKALWVKK